MTVATQAQDTSAQSLRSIRAREMGKRQKEVFDIVLGAQRNGAGDLSRSEIREACERVYGRRFENALVSARVNELIAAGRLVQREEVRACGVTGNNIHAVYVPEKQARLFA